MTAVRKIIDILYWFALSAWFGSVIMTGVTAAIAFPTLRDREVVVPAFSDVIPEAEHFRVAAGSVMYKVFFVNDMIQIVGAVFVLAGFLLHHVLFRVGWRRPAAIIRTLALLGVLCAMSYHVFVLAPRMNHNLQQYWMAAESGGEWKSYQEAFDRDHPMASNILAFNAFAVLVLIGSSACLMHGQRSASSPPSADQANEPALLSGQHAS